MSATEIALRATQAEITGEGSALALVLEPTASRVGRLWRVVCPVDLVVPGRGVAAMVGGTQVAVFRIDDEVFAIDDHDPFSGTALLSRGIVGDVDGEPMVAAPVYKQRFSLRTGVCFDDPTVVISTWDARIKDGRIEVAVW